jgi:hypothetical protein
LLTIPQLGQIASLITVAAKFCNAIVRVQVPAPRSASTLRTG